MVTEAGKELLRNTINTAKFHNRILEENEMWKQWELECGLTMMVSDDDIIKRFKKNHQCSKHRKRDKSRSRDSSRSKYEMAKARQGAGSSNDRWDHSGFAELYPDADVSDKYPSTSVSTVDRHKKKKKKKSRHRSESSDEEIWEEFKRPACFWTRERTLRLIDLLREAPALWNINYPGYRDERVKLKETKRIASIFRVDEDEIVTKIASLMNEFHKEHEKLTLKKLNGTSDNFSENVWFAYEHMTFLKYNKNKRFCNTLKNNFRKDGNTQWIDSSDSYSESEDETAQTTARYCTKSKVEEEKMNVKEKKLKYTSLNSSSYSEEEVKSSQPSLKELSRYIKCKEQEEIVIVKDKKPKYTSLISSAKSENETSQPSAKQSSRCINSKLQDEKVNVNGEKANYPCINLVSCSDSENETSRPTANKSDTCARSEVPDGKREEHGKKSDTTLNLPYVQAYMAKKDSFSVYGEIVAHRMRQAKKSSKAVERAECKINTILRKFEAGFFDSAGDTFK